MKTSPIALAAMLALATRALRTERPSQSSVGGRANLMMVLTFRQPRIPVANCSQRASLSSDHGPFGRGRLEADFVDISAVTRPLTRSLPRGIRLAALAEFSSAPRRPHA